MCTAPPRPATANAANPMTAAGEQRARCAGNCCCVACRDPPRLSAPGSSHSILLRSSQLMSAAVCGCERPESPLSIFLEKDNFSTAVLYSTNKSLYKTKQLNTFERFHVFTCRILGERFATLPPSHRSTHSYPTCRFIAAGLEDFPSILQTFWTSLSSLMPPSPLSAVTCRQIAPCLSP